MVEGECHMEQPALTGDKWEPVFAAEGQQSRGSVPRTRLP